MANYDFQNVLSAIDFEHLVRDLLSKELNLELSTFAEGSDKGIDIRYCNDHKKAIVIQCKRMKVVSKEIIDKEYEKVQKLNPEKYYFVCSNELSVAKTDYIKNTFKKWMKESDEFIYSKSRLNTLLEKHNDVHQKNYKLWLNTSSIFNSLINKPLYERAKSLISDIQRNNIYYVRNESLNNAIEILNNNQFIIISGIPGIGKSTLAKLILWEYLQKDFEILEIRKVIEGEQFLIEDSDSKQVFYYDDFLGENFLKYDVIEGRANDLVQFITRIKNSRNKILIMTTREYILNQAKDTYEKLDDSNLNLAKHTLDLSSYSKRIKSLILYNHLYYSRISPEFIENILKTKAYKKIINHVNYSPRIIEGLTVKLGNILPENYSQEFLDSLDKPFRIWDKAFSSQISNGSKITLILLLSISKPITLTDFKELISHVANKNNKPLGLECKVYDFKNYLKELENSFIKIEITTSKNHFLDFLNPSIKDFLLSTVKNDKETIAFLIKNCIFFDQFIYTVRYLSENFIKEEEISSIIEYRILNDYNSLIATSTIFLDEDEFTITSNEISKLNNIKFYISKTSNQAIIDFLLNRFKAINPEKLSYYDQRNYIEFYIEYYKILNIQYDYVLTQTINGISFIEDVKNFMLLESIDNTKFRKFIHENKLAFNERVSDSIMREIETMDSQDNLTYFKDNTLPKMNLAEYSISMQEFETYFIEKQKILMQKEETENEIVIEKDVNVSNESSNEEEIFNEDEIFKIEMFN